LFQQIYNPLVPVALHGPLLTDQSGLPRYWSTIWSVVSSGQLAESTHTKKLRYIEDLYTHADRLLGKHALDDALASLNETALAEIVESWFVSIRNRSPITVVALELDPMTQDEKLFFKQLGARIAALRKDQAMTQVQLAEAMDVSQQTVASWEVGRRGVPVSNLPLLARTLGVTVEALIGEKTPPARRGPTPKLQQQVEHLSRLPQAKQRVVMEMLEGFLNQAARTG
jgi:transcriptional regulator with XRE-family HTH domain